MIVNKRENRKELYLNFNQKDYMKTWFELVKKMEAEGFTWSSLLENEEWNQYMSPSLYTMSNSRWQEIMEASTRITQILQKTWFIIRSDRKLFYKLKLPLSTWDAVLSEPLNKMFSYFVRYDLVVTENQIKMIEANVDTPTGIMEPSVANRVITEAHFASHPNTIEEKLIKTWKQIVKDYGMRPEDKIFFTSYAWHEEDCQTAHFILKHCLNHPTEFVDIEEIIISKDGLFTPQGEKINYLYRLYPLEYLDEDVDAMGKQIGHMFLNHIASGNVKIINPPSAFMMQSKALLGVIWELYEMESVYYSQEEREWIKSYFLPTYFSSDYFKANGIPYVAKPLWGREGGGVSIIQGDKIEEDRTEYYYNQPKIFQEYIEMPDQSIGTWDGVFHGKLLFGSHIIGGETAGLFLRVGERITGNLSMFMGITKETN
ncbi:glutathionylspermidine synthase family protein (plasmid) [Paenibacillus thiaminolyticus]|uniref:glutathionylspermidine synthase family protein n=1 Tax=Paenibacillus thiaminolyticus TaxID=49283 RepID=UPI00233133E5|nr:glutathionylspermidine synthase family protein [Paenibacillus thiaminolyticus]WCF11451.1 glutathionylspermidine synthase family protein [Paenibacillus thiaminolyticus]